MGSKHFDRVRALAQAVFAIVLMINVFAKIFWEWVVLKISVFFNSTILKKKKRNLLHSHENESKFLGYFDDYPGFQPKTTPT
jgi:hypothetical protein